MKARIAGPTFPCAVYTFPVSLAPPTPDGMRASAWIAEVRGLDYAESILFGLPFGNGIVLRSVRRAIFDWNRPQHQ